MIDNIKNGKRFDYLRPKDELVLSINGIYGVPLISVNFDDWYKNWPKSEKACYCCQCEIQGTSLDSSSLSSDNSCDTVH